MMMAHVSLASLRRMSPGRRVFQHPAKGHTSGTDAAMARPLRIRYPGAYYRVTCRGNERRAIYPDREERKKFDDLLGRNGKLFPIAVHACVFMDNHFYLLVATFCGDGEHGDSGGTGIAPRGGGRGGAPGQRFAAGERLKAGW